MPSNSSATTKPQDESDPQETPTHFQEGAAWGVDIATRRIAIGVRARGSQRWTFSAETGYEPHRSIDRRLDAIRRTTRKLARTARNKTHLKPEAIAVEQPTGQARQPILQWTFAAVVIGLTQAYPTVPVFPVSSGAWKKEVVGSGAATPEDYMRHVRTFWGPVDARNLDEAAAICIAEYLYWIAK